jgi:peptidyl-prolyl cis-trans isomerase-like protein 2
MQQRSIEAFDHVKLDLRLEDEDGEGEGGGVLRNTTEDMKRVLGALQTQEAKASQGKGLE